MKSVFNENNDNKKPLTETKRIIHIHTKQNKPSVSMYQKFSAKDHLNT